MKTVVLMEMGEVCFQEAWMRNFERNDISKFGFTVYFTFSVLRVHFFFSFFIFIVTSFIFSAFGPLNNHSNANTLVAASVLMAKNGAFMSSVGTLPSNPMSFLKKLLTSPNVQVLYWLIYWWMYMIFCIKINHIYLFQWRLHCVHPQVLPELFNLFKTSFTLHARWKFVKRRQKFRSTLF